MDVKNIHWCLRLLYLWLYGPGYFDGNTEALFTWVWNADSDGPSKVLITVMSQHGGDAILRSRSSGGPYYGTYTVKAPSEVLAGLRAAGVTAEPPDEVKRAGGLL